MVRPQCQRRIAGSPRALVFKPRGVSLHDLGEVRLDADGWETLRLCDHEGLDQGQAAKRMGVSRPTVSRVLGRARAAVAKALVEGQALVIDLPHDAVQECTGCRKLCAGIPPRTRCPHCGGCHLHLVLNHPSASTVSLPASSSIPIKES